MQNNYLKIKNISVALFLSTAILTVLRTLLLFLGFDFQTSFFKNDIHAYLLYVFFLALIAAAYLMCRSVKSDYSPKKGLVSDAVHSLSVIFFSAAFILYILKLSDYTNSLPFSSNLVRAVSYILCLVSAPLSAVYYVLRLFSRKEKGALAAITGACPSIFLASLLIEKFATVSASAASLSHFADIISLLVLAFFILGDSKRLIPVDKTDKPTLFSFFACFISLAFSTVPDLITILAGINIFGTEAIFFLIFKLVYMIYSLYAIFLFAKASKEVK